MSVDGHGAPQPVPAADQPAPASRLSARARLWLAIVLVLAIVVASFWLAVNPAWVARFGSWGYVGAFLISMIASATLVLPAPGIAVVIAMSPALNPLLLAVAAGLGSAVGELTGYLAGASGSALIPESQRHRFDQVHDLTNRYGAPLLALLAALPFPLFDFAGIVAGILRMRVVTFLVAVAAGKIVKYLVLIEVGASFLGWLQRLLG
jgi:membrane protein YqaA with SNARE-associated domain